MENGTIVMHGAGSLCVYCRVTWRVLMLSCGDVMM
mgnify:CR=1 FL=1